MTNDEFKKKIREVHEAFNDLFIAVQGIPVQHEHIDKKQAAIQTIIDAKKKMIDAGLTHY